MKSSSDSHHTSLCNTHPLFVCVSLIQPAWNIKISSSRSSSTSLLYLEEAVSVSTDSVCFGGFTVQIAQTIIENPITWAVHVHVHVHVHLHVRVRVCVSLKERQEARVMTAIRHERPGGGFK